MAVANFSRKYEYDGFGSIVVVKDLGDIPAGVTLDVTGITDTTIKAGRVLVQNDSTKEVKPLGIESDAYVSLPGGHSYFGILKESILTSAPLAAVLRIGTVNAAAAAKSVGAPYTADIKNAFKHIDFIY